MRPTTGPLVLRLPCRQARTALRRTRCGRETHWLHNPIMSGRRCKRCCFSPRSIVRQSGMSDREDIHALRHVRHCLKLCAFLLYKPLLFDSTYSQPPGSFIRYQSRPVMTTYLYCQTQDSSSQEPGQCLGFPCPTMHAMGRNISFVDDNDHLHFSASHIKASVYRGIYGVCLERGPRHSAALANVAWRFLAGRSLTRM